MTVVAGLATAGLMVLLASISPVGGTGLASGVPAVAMGTAPAASNGPMASGGLTGATGSSAASEGTSTPSAIPAGSGSVDPAFVLSPTSGVAYGSSTLAGQGLTPSRSYWLCFDATPRIQSGYCDSFESLADGSYDSPRGIPSMPAGSYSAEIWTASAGGSFVVAAPSLFVMQPSLDPLNPSSGVPGVETLLTAYGLAADSSYALCFDSAPLMQSSNCVTFGPTASDGSSGATVTVPTMTAGPYYVEVWSSFPTGTFVVGDPSPFTVEPTVPPSFVITPGNGTTNTPLAYEAVGLGPDTEYWFCFDAAPEFQSSDCNGFFTDESGSAGSDYAYYPPYPPGMPAGAYYPEVWTAASDGTFVVAAPGTFTMEPWISPSSSSIGVDGGPAYLGATGLAADTSYEVCLDSAYQVESSYCAAVGPADTIGELNSASFTVPAAPVGPYYEELWTGAPGGSFVALAPAPFTVAPALPLSAALTPTSGTVGSGTTITAFGLASNTEYWVCLDPTEDVQSAHCEGFSTDDTGSDAGSGWALPHMPGGNYYPEVWSAPSGGTFLVAANETFSVEPSMSLGPYYGSVGAALSIGTSGLAASVEYWLCLDSAAGSQSARCVTFSTDPTGSFSGTIDVPSAPAGPYYPDVWSASSGGSMVVAAPQPFVVEPILPLGAFFTPYTASVGGYAAPVGVPISFAATGLAPTSDYWACFDPNAGTQSSHCVEFSTDVTGAASTSLYIPNMPTGAYHVEVWTEPSGGLRVVTTPGVLTVEPSVSLGSFDVTGGSEVSLSAAGLAGDQDYVLCLDSSSGTESSDCVAFGPTDSDGTFNGEFTVPSTPGLYYPEVWTRAPGDTFEAASATPLTVEPWSTLSVVVAPTSAVVSNYCYYCYDVAVSASGLSPDTGYNLCFDPTEGVQSNYCTGFETGSDGSTAPSYVPTPTMPKGSYHTEVWTTAEGATDLVSSPSLFTVLPTLSMDTSGAEGSSISVTAWGLNADATYALCWDASPLSQGTHCDSMGPTDSNGYFSGAVEVPTVAPGGYYPELWTSSPGGTFVDLFYGNARPFIVEPSIATLAAALSPTQSQVNPEGCYYCAGAQLAVTGLAPSTNYDVCFDPTSGTESGYCDGVTTDDTGAFAGGVSLPPMPANEPYYVEVWNLTGTFEVAAPSQFNVESALEVYPSAASAGGTVQFQGWGLQAGESYSLCFDNPAGAGNYCGSISSAPDSDGYLSGSFTVPAAPAGPTYLELWRTGCYPYGYCPGPQASSPDPFTVEPSVPLSFVLAPTNGTGNGYSGSMAAYGLSPDTQYSLCYDITAGTESTYCNPVGTDASGSIVEGVGVPALPGGTYYPEIWTASPGGTDVVATTSPITVGPVVVSFGSEGAAGSSVGVTVAGLSADTSYELCLDSTLQTESSSCTPLGPTNPAGGYNGDVSVPSASAGLYYVELWTSSPGGEFIVSGDPFEVAPSLPLSTLVTPTNGTTETGLTWVAYGLAPNTQYFLCFDTTPGTESDTCDGPSATSDGTGALSSGFSVSSNLPAGTYYPEVWTAPSPDGSFVVAAPAPFEPDPTVTLGSSLGTVASTPLLTATDLAADTSYAVCFDSLAGAQGADCTSFGPTDTTGSFSGDISVPDSPGGPRYVEVWTTYPGGTLVTESTPFLISATIALSDAGDAYGYVGDTVDISGTGFGASLPATDFNLTFGSHGALAVSDCATNASGALSGCAFVVPAATTGPYDVTLSDVDGNVNSNLVAFTVQPSLELLGTTSGPAGTVVNVSGAGYGPSSSIAVYFDGHRVTQSPCTTNPLGSFTAAACNFTVPSAVRGPHTVTAKDALGHENTNTVTFLVTVVPMYNVTFKENGLPSATRLTRGWTVSFGGIVNHSTQSSIAFSVRNGTYLELAFGPSGYEVTRGGPSGSIRVDGTNLTENVTFATGPTDSLTFSETGLPKNGSGVQSWCVRLDGDVRCTSATSTKFVNLTPASYGYAVVSPLVGQTITAKLSGRPIATSGSLSVAANTRIVYAFVYLYDLTFDESGLPAHASWSVKVGKVTHSSSTGETITFQEPNGSYAYKVTPPAGTTASPKSGRASVDNASTTVFVASYALSFNETGLPSGTSWSVKIGPTQQSTTGTAIVFYEGNGSYRYKVTVGSGDSLSPSSGLALISDGPTTEFLAAFAVQFNASGLPNGTTWSVTLNKVTSTDRVAAGRGTITFYEGNGTHPYTVGPIPGYRVSAVPSRAFVNATTAYVNVTFSPPRSHHAQPIAPGLLSAGLLVVGGSVASPPLVPRGRRE